MSTYPDTPDGQRGQVASEMVVAVVAGGVDHATVDLPVNCKALWILTGPMPDPRLTVTGAQSGIIYPSYPLWTQDVAGDLNLSAVAIVTSLIDVTATIHWASAPAGAWTVISDNGERFALDAALAAATAPSGTIVPDYAVQVAGSDGTDLRPLSVDATGALKVVGSSFPPVFAAPGAALPTDALLVGGSDGADLRPLATDATGQLKVIDETLAGAIGTAAGAPPANVVVIGGVDPTHVRALDLDSAGQLKVIDETLVQIVGVPTGAVPTEAAMVAFTDGVDLRVPITSKTALPYGIASAPSELAGDRPPNELTFTSLPSQAASAAIVPAPGLGKRLRIYYVYAWPENSAAIFYCVGNDVNNLAVYLCRGQSPAGVSPPPANLPLTGLPLETNAAFFIVISAGQAGATVGYTIENV